MYLLTVAVHSGRQYPLNENDSWLGGIAILSEYTKPSSIIPASNGRRFCVIWNRIPELSVIPWLKRNHNIQMDVSKHNSNYGYVHS